MGVPSWGHAMVDTDATAGTQELSHTCSRTHRARTHPYTLSPLCLSVSLSLYLGPSVSVGRSVGHSLAYTQRRTLACRAAGGAQGRAGRRAQGAGRRAQGAAVGKPMRRMAETRITAEGKATTAAERGGGGSS